MYIFVHQIFGAWKSENEQFGLFGSAMDGSVLFKNLQYLVVQKTDTFSCLLG